MKKLFYLLTFLIPGLIFSHEPPQTKSEIQNYIDTYVKIFDIETKINERCAYEICDITPAYKFAIKNLGDETITSMTATVFFLDNNGEPFYERSHLIVSKSSISSSRMRILKPNYTFRGGDESFFWTIKKISPSEWSETIKVEITSVLFEE